MKTIARLLLPLIIILLLAGLFSCEENEIAPTNTTEYFSDFDSLTDSIGYITYQNWRIQVHLKDSFVYELSNFNTLLHQLDTTEYIINPQLLKLMKRRGFIILKDIKANGQFRFNTTRTDSSNFIIIRPPYVLHQIVHEFGHYRYFRTEYFSGGYSAKLVDQIYENGKRYWKDTYAALNKYEYFAELFTFYHLDKHRITVRGDFYGRSFIEKVMMQPLNE